jgi:hypothetical protein
MRRFFLLTLGGAVAVGIACSARELPPKGEIVVVLSSDMSPPRDFDVVHVRVTELDAAGNDGREILDSDYSFPSSVTLPATGGIIAGDDPAVRVHVQVVARQLGKARVLREVRTAIPQDRIAALPVTIQWLCAGDDYVVDSPQGVTSKCPKDQTCIAGSCKSMDVDPATLGTFDPSALGGASGNDTCFDTASCFAGDGVRVVTPSSDCTIEATPPFDHFNVALELPPDGPGVCTSSVCLVPLDEDPISGWTRDGNSVRLPAEVCRRMSTVLVSSRCASKIAYEPPCGTASGTHASDPNGVGPIPTPDGGLGDGGPHDAAPDSPVEAGPCNTAGLTCTNALAGYTCVGGSAIGPAPCDEGDAGEAGVVFCSQGLCADRDVPTGPLGPDPPLASSYVVDQSNPALPIVTDKTTGLVWMYAPPPGTYDLASAGQYCATREAPNKWRLPTVQEFVTIFDFGTLKPNTTAFVNFQSGAQEIYWTATTSNSGAGQAFSFNAAGNNTIAVYGNGAPNRVVCVR